MGKNTMPAQIEAIPAQDATDMVNSLLELRNLGKPQTDAEVEERCSEYFRFCAGHGMRPGIEGLSLALGIDRTTFWRWCHGTGCSNERAEIVRAARQATIAYIEAAQLSGRLNPVSSIFLLKNWAGYRDSSSLEIETRPNNLFPNMTPEQIAQQIEKDIPIDTEYED